MHRLAVFALLLLAPCPSPLIATDWLEFRGPNGTGHYAGKPLPTEWGPTTNVTWKTPIPGKGWSSPIHVGGKLVMTTAVPLSGNDTPDYSLRAVAVDAKSGSLLWDVELFREDGKTAPPPHKKNSHASPTPVSDGKTVVAHFGHMGTAALDLDGKVLWKTQELTYHPMHGNGGSPILVGDAVVFCCDGRDVAFVVALDKATGKVRWKTPRNTTARMTFSFATCQAVTAAGKTVIVSPAADYVMGYDPATGKELWRAKYPRPGWSLICRPVEAFGKVWLSTGYDAAHLIAVDPWAGGSVKPALVWKEKFYTPNTPTPLLVGDELYLIADMGFLSCIDARTGKTHYSERLPGKGYSASPIAWDGKIYLTSEEGVGQVLAAGKEYKELSRSDLGEKTFATFVPVDGALFVRTETQLYRFDRR
ncbi:MAG: PQQ-binding-like beta-propeller repeat protein [Gemmataceae bacterium]